MIDREAILDTMYEERPDNMTVAVASDTIDETINHVIKSLRRRAAEWEDFSHYTAAHALREFANDLEGQR